MVVRLAIRYRLFTFSPFEVIKRSEAQIPRFYRGGANSYEDGRTGDRFLGKDLYLFY